MPYQNAACFERARLGAKAIKLPSDVIADDEAVAARRCSAGPCRQDAAPCCSGPEIDA